MGDVTGKLALITGGTSGIGLATARLLCEGGARVIVTGRSRDALACAEATLGANAVAIDSDAASETAIDTLAERVGGEFGSLDLVFLNAGITRHAPLGEWAASTYDDLFAINARGAFLAAQRFAPLIRRGGSIVFNTSAAHVGGHPGMSAYAATKAAVRSMTRSFARELLAAQIRVNAVMPGPIDTDFADKNLAPDLAATAKDVLRASNPMGRAGHPDEVAKAVLFLAFDATYTTGAELAVDGGAAQL